MKYENPNNIKILLSELTKILNNAVKINQADLFNKLISLENDFKKILFNTKYINEIYRIFIMSIVSDKKNILSAKPYFREKNIVFCKYISKAIKNADIETLKKFHINYKFIAFIMQHYPEAALPEDAKKFLNEIIQIRHKLITDNMPLAINRAKIFYRKIPPSTLSLSDFIHISVLGLITGIDKYVGKHTRVFNGVCIGNMVGNMIKNYSDTVIKFYPSEKAILYRANSLKFKEKINDLDTLVRQINKSYINDRKMGIKTPKKFIQKKELANLMNAASSISLDEKIYHLNAELDSETQLNDSLDPENQVIKKDLIEKIKQQIEKLPFLFQKIAKMKGGIYA